MKDKTITCIGCGRPFDFSSGEQEFFKKKDFNDPKRCPQCRAKRKQEKFDRLSREELPYPTNRKF